MNTLLGLVLLAALFLAKVAGYTFCLFLFGWAVSLIGRKLS